LMKEKDMGVFVISPYDKGGRWVILNENVQQLGY
jgi:predicted aldo/keto reductase-like oxidoreductase